MGRPRRIGALAAAAAAAALVLPGAAAGQAFTPTLTATAGSPDQPAKVGHHPPFTTVVTQPDGQATIKKAVVTLPLGLFANVNALQTLCPPDKVDEFACPAGSRVGSVKIVIPTVSDPVTGPVFIAANPGGVGLPGLAITLTHGGVAGVLAATTALTGGQLVTTLDGLPDTPVSSFELTFDGGPRGLFTVGNELCASPPVTATFISHAGQTVTQSSAINVIGSCSAVAPPDLGAPAPPVAPPTQAPSTARPSLSLSVRGVAAKPVLTLTARSAPGAAKLRSVRLALPSSRLAFVRAALARGLTIRSGTAPLAGAAWSLSRDGALTVQAPNGGSSAITATVQSGALRGSAALKKLARRGRALPRLTFVGRVSDVQNARYDYRLTVQPQR